MIRLRFWLPVLLLFSIPAALAAEPGFQAITLFFGESWTGNAYTQPDYNVTGSEAGGIDPALGGGARFVLSEPFLFSFSALTIDPRVTLGLRRYLLYPSGRVVPTQIETALGATENLEPGVGSARVLTTRIEAPVGIEISLGERAAVAVAISPTLVLRLRAGDAVYEDQASDLNPMYSFFYGRLRWLRPDFHLAFRFDVSDYLAFALRSSTSISILDLADSTLPWWDQFQTGVGLEVSLSPPFSGLVRQPEDNREITLPETDN